MKRELTHLVRAWLMSTNYVHASKNTILRAVIPLSFISGSQLNKKFIYKARVTVSLQIFFLRATPSAYGSSQARGSIRAAAANLHHSHSNARSKLHIRPTPQLTATLDP